jgi:myo-inositol-1(or 4)-monophosphatase
MDGVAQVGAIYDPNRQELFTAERGAGAFLNGRPLHVSSTGTLIDAMLVTGFPYDVHKRIPEIVGLFGEFVGTARAVRRLGSAALDLCYVAAGYYDGFFETGLNPWDVAAGSLIITEAGPVTKMDGTPFTSRGGDTRTNQLIHDPMLRSRRWQVSAGSRQSISDRQPEEQALSGPSCG